MRNIIIIVLVGVCLLAPALATAGHHGHTAVLHQSHHSSFEVDGDQVILVQHDKHSSDEVIISRNGDLEINGDRIKTDGKSRKMLKKFYKEAVILEEKADLIAEDATELAGNATAFAAVTVMKALRSFSDDEDLEDKLEDLEDTEMDFEEQAERIGEMGDEIGERADRLVDLADDLCDRVAELDDLDWFLDR